MSLNGSFPTCNNHTLTNIQLAPRTPSLSFHSRKINSTHQQSPSHNRAIVTDNTVKAEASSGQSGPPKASRTHQELHRELLLAHRRGLVLSSRTELQQVLERRKREQSDQEDEGHSRTPLKDVLLKRQQKQLETEKHEEEKVEEEAQLMEFVRVRQNLRKIHTVIHNKTSHK
ncbi:protein FAM107B [Genypterus blacodes]|uniref:protein FAM107B n=1 Tax=Genypterus blacodes TaxID=154954 RepID=UPI003F76F76F